MKTSALKKTLHVQLPHSVLYFATALMCHFRISVSSSHLFLETYFILLDSLHIFLGSSYIFLRSSHVLLGSANIILETSQNILDSSHIF